MTNPHEPLRPLHGHTDTHTMADSDRQLKYAPSKLLVRLSQGWPPIVLYCARRTRSFSGRAFREHRGHRRSLPLFSFQARLPLLSRTVVTAAAGIRALLGSCHRKAPWPVLTGGAACSTFRSTMSRNGTSCCAKRRFAMASNRALALAAAARLFSPSL